MAIVPIVAASAPAGGLVGAPPSAIGQFRMSASEVREWVSAFKEMLGLLDQVKPMLAAVVPQEAGPQAAAASAVVTHERPGQVILREEVRAAPAESPGESERERAAREERVELERREIRELIRTRLTKPVVIDAALMAAPFAFEKYPKMGEALFTPKREAMLRALLEDFTVEEIREAAVEVVDSRPAGDLKTIKGMIVSMTKGAAAKAGEPAADASKKEGEES